MKIILEILAELLYFIERIDSGRGCVTRLCGGVVWEGCVTSFVVGKSKKTQLKLQKLKGFLKKTLKLS